jgi:hypothetical protein
MVCGGLPEKDGLYLPVTPDRNDGATVYKLTVKDVPVDGFCRSPSTTRMAIWCRISTMPIL